MVGRSFCSPRSQAGKPLSIFERPLPLFSKGNPSHDPRIRAQGPFPCAPHFASHGRFRGFPSSITGLGFGVNPKS